MSSVLRLDLLAKIILAALLGAAIGIEREIKGKPAGLRTNILICVGAALFTDMSIAVSVAEGVGPGDPTRIAAQIVSGVGFLGAGTILQSGGNIIGLTSAATIWVVAAIGMAIGAGHYIEGVGTTFLVGVVLAGLGRIEHRLRRVRRVGNCTVRARPGTPTELINDIMRKQGLRVLEEDVYDHADDRVFELRIAGPARQFEVVCEVLLGDDAVFGVHVV